MRRDRERAEVIDAGGTAGPLRQGHRDDGPTDRQPRGFPYLTLQAVAKPPPGADVHTKPPVKTFEHSQRARGAEVAASCRMANLHDSRVHEQRYVNANRFIVQQTSRASHLGTASRTGVAESFGGRAGRCRRRWCVAGLCQQAPESPRRRGAGAKGNTTNSWLVGLATGQERCRAWRRGAQARPVVPAPSQRANTSRWNLRTLTRKQPRMQLVRC